MFSSSVLSSSIESSQPNSLSQAVHQRAMQASERFQKSVADLISALEDVEQHQVYLQFGHSSLFQYAVQELRLSESVAYPLITVMRKAKEVPQLKVQMQEGKINLGNARRIAPVLTQANSSEWLDKAATMTQRQLEKEVVRVHPLSAVQERAQYVTENRIRLEVGLSESQMLKLRKAQDLVCQATAKSASLEDTLIALTEFYLKHRDPVEKAKRVTAKKGSLAAQATSGEEMVTREESRDSEEMVTREESKMSEEIRGRELIPAAILHAVRLRDQGKCAFLNAQGRTCGQTRWLEVHHRVPVSSGGTNSVDNLITLCSGHHRWVHSTKKVHS